MTRWAITTILLTLTMFTFIGCSACGGPHDFDYPTYGGIHHRSHPSYGRVGSTFSDPGSAGGGPSADSNLEPHPESQPQEDVGLDEDDFDEDRERADEDLDDDLEGLDEDLEELDRKLEELDLENKKRDEDLESIEPLEDVKLNSGSSSKQAQSRKRRRGALPTRPNRLR